MPDTIEHVTAATSLRAAPASWLPITLGSDLSAEPDPRVAVLIPCFNEEASIGKVVSDFQTVLPRATVYVYDNNSTDRTMLEARAAGRLVRSERRQGKGHVVRRMFADVEADVFILVDGDDTYDAAAAPAMLALMREHRLDMVTAARTTEAPEAYRPGHRFGNALLSSMVRWVFGHGVSDMLSGYRAFSRRFVKSFPALSTGFETETEFTVHALELHMPTLEIHTAYRGRQVGSASKLKTIGDGWRILCTIAQLIKHERPLQSFGTLSVLLLATGLGLGLPVVWAFMETGLVQRLPTALLATGFVLLSLLSLVCGLVLDAISADAREAKLLAYLSLKPLVGMRDDTLPVLPPAAVIRHIAGASQPPAAYDADIIILALDRGEETCAAIDSACAQRGLTRHVTVLDQGSRPEVLDRIARHVADRPDVTLLACEQNLGVGGGRNHASAFGRGRIISALDNDAEFATPDTLATALAALDTDPSIGVLGFRILVHATGEDDVSSWGYPLPLLTRAAECFDTATFVGAGHAIRRSTWNQAGAYDETLFFCWEEYDFSLRAIAAGWRVHYRGDLAVRHKVSPERRVAWSDMRWSQHVRNRLYIARKSGAGWLSLVPRAAAYAIKGARNRRLAQTVRAIRAAGSMEVIAPIALPHAAQAYLQSTDTAARGSWRDRLRNEVLAAIPGDRTRHAVRVPPLLATSAPAAQGS